MSLKAGVITFPGSNCDRDLAVALQAVTGTAPSRIWHRDTELPAGLDLVALPGGFSYGDYLRCGAIAAKSPVMRAVIAAAERGVAVLGICNGFQVLTETELLPGALMRNQGQRFVCRTATLSVCNVTSPFTHGFTPGETIRIPVAHHDGNYFADEATLEILEAENRIAFRYAEDERGSPNGSLRDIAGVLSANGRVLGMMPHPERAIEPASHPSLGGDDGRRLFANIVTALVNA
ncbi:MAG: phosphoribosylformylglycinamidine synthase subunit PurQ [Erythrobacter sp.]|jgi:phosphoribosylformylglycinamidine synthase|nr:phosphoribosylformylglycinamidine synthase subunit PurQ [Erythrobacter sp.]